MDRKLVWRKVTDLIPYARNSRTHSDEQVAQIAASIKEFGWTNPILTDGDNGIIAGHGRLAAARKLGHEEVPTIELVGLTETQKKAYIIADNRLALNAGWDNEMLTIELNDLMADGFALEILGFDPKELNALLEPEVVEGLTDEDAVPDVPEEPKTKIGDIYQLGNHRLMCGDSTSIEHLERLCDGQAVDMWLTDPPYNVDMTSKNEMLEKAGKARKDKASFGIKNDSMSDEDFRQFLRDAYTAADSVMKAGAVFYIWHADSEGYNFRGAAKDAGWIIRQCLIWKKSVFAIGRQDYHWKHEPCLYGWKEGAGHLWAADRKQTTILEFDKPNKSGEHPTMKPVALFEYQMLNNTKGGDIVLDSFGGSGTTLLAAEKHGRYARIMELDPKYCDVIVKRWEDFTGKKAELITFSELENA
jgi:site-specific DNA-methyltransferase (adenine-specific)